MKVYAPLSPTIPTQSEEVAGLQDPLLETHQCVRPLLASSPTLPFILVCAILSNLEGQQISPLLRAPNSSSSSEAMDCETEAKNRLMVFPIFWTSVSGYTADWMQEGFGEDKDNKITLANI